MKCFYHPEKDALGTCKNCCKGICGECIIDVGNGIACDDACRDAVNQVNALVDYNKEQLKNIPKSMSFITNTGDINKNSYLFNAYFLLSLGLIIIVLNIYLFVKNNQIGFSFVWMGTIGIIFILFSFFSFRNAKKVGNAFAAIITDEEK
ncbi:MAG: hypothetical protein IV090_20825 [Candidatus Sericytochromatia bacterium]|nr:hypothetical protein [Candidatus Sericytochromatia bacterium]